MNGEERAPGACAECLSPDCIICDCGNPDCYCTCVLPTPANIDASLTSKSPCHCCAEEGDVGTWYGKIWCTRCAYGQCAKCC